MVFSHLSKEGSDNEANSDDDEDDSDEDDEEETPKKVLFHVVLPIYLLIEGLLQSWV